MILRSKQTLDDLLKLYECDKTWFFDPLSCLTCNVVSGPPKVQIFQKQSTSERKFLKDIPKVKTFL